MMSSMRSSSSLCSPLAPASLPVVEALTTATTTPSSRHLSFCLLPVGSAANRAQSDLLSCVGIVRIDHKASNGSAANSWFVRCVFFCDVQIPAGPTAAYDHRPHIDLLVLFGQHQMAPSSAILASAPRAGGWAAGALVRAAGTESDDAAGAPTWAARGSDGAAGTHVCIFNQWNIFVQLCSALFLLMWDFDFWGQFRSFFVQNSLIFVQEFKF